MLFAKPLASEQLRQPKLGRGPNSRKLICSGPASDGPLAERTFPLRSRSKFKLRSKTLATAELKKGDVKDIGLADAGKRKIEWAAQQMPVLESIRKRFVKEQPLKGLRVSACLHVTSETAQLDDRAPRWRR